MRVRLDNTFFRKERDQGYSDWKLALWRELFQNAIDQCSTEIRISLTADDNGVVTLGFADNGPGMTRKVLDEVYFEIGATTKTSGDQIGGMGRARVLTCFAMRSYQIRSQDYLVRGEAGEYEVEAAPYFSGCALEIVIDDATQYQLERKFVEYLTSTRITARVYYNGSLMTERAAHPGRHIRDLMADGKAFAEVWVNKSVPKIGSAHKVLVSVNGVTMFSKQTQANGQVTINLEPSLSRDVLTANRDGLRGAYSTSLDEYLSELAVDTQSAIRPRFARHTTVLRGHGMRIIRRSKPVPVAPEAPSAQASENLELASVTALPERADSYEETPLVDVFDSWLGRTFGDIYLFDETESPAMHRTVANYKPDNWQLMSINGQTVRKGGNILRVLLMWHTAISYAVEVALEQLGRDELAYAVGFVFSEHLADHRQQDSGHVFSLRPVNALGRLDYSVSSRKSLKKMISLAKHEVTHVEVSWHSERFSILREQIDMRFDEAECLRRMKLALRNMPNVAAEQVGYRTAA